MRRSSRDEVRLRYIWAVAALAVVGPIPDSEPTDSELARKPSPNRELRALLLRLC